MNNTAPPTPVPRRRKKSFRKTTWPVGQPGSEKLLLNLLRKLTILYLVMSVLSTPIMVMSGVSFARYVRLNRAGDKEISLLDYLLVFTSGSLPYSDCSGLQGESGELDLCEASGIDSSNKLATNIISHQNQSLTQLGDSLNSGGVSLQNKARKMFTKSYLQLCLWLDSILQLIFIVGCAILEYISFKVKQKQKGLHIEDYSLEVSGVPLLFPHMVLSKFQQFLLGSLIPKYELVLGNSEILDIVSACGEQQYRELVLTTELNLKLSQQLFHLNAELGDEQRGMLQKRIRTIQRMLAAVDTKTAANDTLWITFETRQARYLALRFIESSSAKFMNHRIRAKKAPHPSEIIWPNLHAPTLKVLLCSLISFVICMGALLLFDLLILYVHKTYNLILASVVVFMLQMLLKQIIIITVTKLERHKYMSRMNLSLFCKLSIFLYINTALIIFISSFNFGDSQFAKTFSIGEYSQINLDWYQHVGLSIMLNFVIEVIYINVRPVIELFKHHATKKMMELISDIWGRNPGKTKKDNEEEVMLKSELDICYAQIITMVMFANTYTFTHPIFYPLCALCTLIAFYSHRKYIDQFTQPAPYNNDNLNSTAIHYIYGSVLVHWLVLYLGYTYLPALIFACIGVCILFTKTTMVSLASDLIRRKFGPLCFDKFEEVHDQGKTLTSLLSFTQLSQYVLAMEEKIKASTHIYNSKYEEQDFVSKGYLERYVKAMENKIRKLEEVKDNLPMNKDEGIAENTIIGSPHSNNKPQQMEIKGTVCYMMPENIFGI